MPEPFVERRRSTDAGEDIAVMRRANELSKRLRRATYGLFMFTVFVLSVSVVIVSVVAASAQRSAHRQAVINDELSIELECRSSISARFSIAHADVTRLLAEGLIVLAEDGDLLPLTPEVKIASEHLRKTAEMRSVSVDACSLEDLDE